MIALIGKSVCRYDLMLLNGWILIIAMDYEIHMKYIVFNSIYFNLHAAVSSFGNSFLCQWKSSIAMTSSLPYIVGV